MRLIYTLLAAAMGLTVLASCSGASAGDPAAGEQKATVCQSCHGPSGNKSITPDIPVLAGQHRDYLAHALRAYRSGDRQQAVMSTFAGQLSDEDILDLAAYYSVQDGDLHDLSVN